MKEQKLIQALNKIETLGSIVEQMLQEMNYLKAMVMGDHALIKELPGFDAALEVLKAKNTTDEDKAIKTSPEQPLDDNEKVVILNVED